MDQRLQQLKRKAKAEDSPEIWGQYVRALTRVTGYWHPTKPEPQWTDDEVQDTVIHEAMVKFREEFSLVNIVTDNQILSICRLTIGNIWKDVVA